MKKYKYRVEHLSLYHFQAIEERLAVMEAKGWRLEKIGTFFWRYRRSEPAQVHYAVTYRQDASQFSPPTEGQQSLEALCADAGWEKVTDWFQMQIFRSALPHPVPLETDEALRLENIRRSMRKNFLPSHLLLMGFALFLIAAWGGQLLTDPVRFFQSSSGWFCLALGFLLAVFLLCSLMGYWRWYRKSVQSVAEGGTCIRAGHGSERLSQGFLGILILLTAVYLFFEWYRGGSRRVFFWLFYTAAMFLLIYVVQKTREYLKAHGFSKGVNVLLTLGVDIILAVALASGLIWGVIHFDWFGESQNNTYLYQNVSCDYSPIDLPLTRTDLTGQMYEHISRRRHQGGSIFLAYSSCWEIVFSAEGMESLHYEITDVQSEWLRQIVREDHMEANDSSPLKISWRPEDPAPWHTEQVWRRYLDGEPDSTYLLQWSRRIVALSLNTPPDSAQKSIIGICLKPPA